MNPQRNNADWVVRPYAERLATYNQRTGALSWNPADIPTNQTVYSSHTFSATAPLKVYFDFTNRCNLQCAHCITGSSPYTDITSELSAERCSEVITEMAEFGVLEIATGGGEPLFNPHWTRLFSTVVSAGMNLIVTTNGLLIRPSTIEYLASIRPLEIRVSFDGGILLHERVRGANTYRRSLSALSQLCGAGLTTAARITLCRGFENEIADLFRDLAQTGVRNIKIAVIKSAGRALTEGKSLLLGQAPAQESVAKLRELGRLNGLALQLSSDDFPVLGSHSNDPKLRDEDRPNCGAGFETCYISPQGFILGCSAIPNFKLGQLKHSSFREGSVYLTYRGY